MQKSQRFLLGLTLVVFVLTVGLSVKTLNGGSTDQVDVQVFTYNEFVDKVNTHGIKTVHFDETSAQLRGETAEGKPFTTDNPKSTDFRKYLLEHDVAVKEAAPESASSIILWEIIKFLLTIALIAFGVSWLMNKLTKIQHNATSLSLDVTDKSSVTFDEVAGNEEAKEDMMELVDFLKNPAKFKKYGAKPPRGTILYGPPGTGKTLLAKALAGTAGVSFIAISGASFVEKYVGVGASRVRQVFETARKKAPCIIFIDELDAVGKRRSSGGGAGNDERDQTLNQILVEMDGFTGNEGILVIAATNRLDTLDDALLRSGRFDRHIRVELPDLDARYEILKIHSRNKPLHPEVDLKEVAKMTTYMSGADLANVMNEAGIYAARFDHKGIMLSDIDRAINKLIAGEAKKSRGSITRKDKEITAYHEAGHALVAKLLTKKSIPKVTIIPTTKGAGGYTLIAPEERMFETRQDMLNEIAISLGGRAAEEIIFGSDNITGGASQDLRNVTQIALRMVKQYGMSEEVGLINVNDLYGESITSSTTDKIAEEIRAMVDRIYGNALDLLNQNKAILHDIAHGLLDRETLYERDLDAILNGEPLTVIGVAEADATKVIKGRIRLRQKGEMTQ